MDLEHKVGFYVGATELDPRHVKILAFANHMTSMGFRRVKMKHA